MSPLGFSGKVTVGNVVFSNCSGRNLDCDGSILVTLHTRPYHSTIPLPLTFREEQADWETVG